MSAFKLSTAFFMTSYFSGIPKINLVLLAFSWRSISSGRQKQE